MPPRPLGALARLFADKTGWQLVRTLMAPGALPEATTRDIETLRSVRAYTMTSTERQWALINAVRYIVQARIPGDLVECGVWRGGAAMAVALTLIDSNDRERGLWLYDTFTGMTEPGSVDRRSSDGAAAHETWARQRRGDGENEWCRASLEDVRANIEHTGYPTGRIRYVKGPVEHTLLATENRPQRIALLRLDTDWYESTRVELEQLYPRLSPGGVLIIDDYGHWEGARKAVDEFFAARGERLLLNRIDDTGRIAIAPGPRGDQAP
ncbi:MAG TPA: TylF/MycF/NovP-related O-methyltransferase [Steroidobacteraceae bacterium]|nr:TylF/MycF/NovP-related O-methyltransferase [Steroidobacteraceae bacterium]